MNLEIQKKSIDFLTLQDSLEVKYKGCLHKVAKIVEEDFYEVECFV